MAAEEEFDFSGSMGGQAAKEAKGSSDGTFRRFDYFSLKDEEQVDLRFLTDVVPADSNPVAWITVEQHNFVPTVAAPKGDDGEPVKGWPKSITAVCRHDKVFSKRYSDCYVCDVMRTSEGKKYKATTRTWALAVIREPVYKDGKFIGNRDKTKELVLVDENGKPTGDTAEVYDIRIINMAYKNFFSKVQGMSGLWGTVLDRDFRVTREGDGLKTDYSFSAHDPVDIEPGKRYDLRDPEIFNAKYGESKLPDLRKLIAEKASDDFYARFFGAGSGNAGPATPSTDVESEKAKSLRDRIKTYAGEQGVSASAGRAL